MSILTYESPLQWPEGWPATPRARQRTDSGFSPYLNLAEVLSFLDEEVTALGVRACVLFTDIENIAVERLQRKQGARTGASLAVRYGEQAYHLACDRWQAMEHNIYALHLALRNLRAVEKWGVGGMHQLLLGFRAGETVISPAVASPETHSHTLEDWMEELGLGPTATLDDATAIYHRRARQLTHDSHAMARLNVIMDEARRKLSPK